MRRDRSGNLPAQLLRTLKVRIYPAPEQDNGTRLAAQISVEGLLAAIVLNLATVFTAMFATRLGADSSQIGLLASLPQWAGLAILIPGTILAGRFHHSRRPVETSLLATGFLYGLAGLAPYMGEYRIWYLMAMVALANAPMSLYNTTWQNYFSDVVPVNNRNSLYTLRTSMTFAAGIIIVQVTGLLLNQAASETARIHLYQGCYFLAFAFSILQWLVIRQSPDIVTEDNHIRLRQVKNAVKDIVNNRRFLVFIGISFLFHIGWYMAWPLFLLLQVNYMGANEAWLSYVLVSASLLQWATVRHWGRFIEKHGVRLTIVIGAAGLTVNPLFAMLSSYLPTDWRMPGMLVFNLVNAATFSAFQLSLLQCLLEVLPRKNKQLNLSFYTALLIFSNALMQWFGVVFYVRLGDSHSAMTISLVTSSLIRLVGTLLFFWRWFHLRHEPDAGIRFDLRP
jgi:hypothetical protein